MSQCGTDPGIDPDAARAQSGAGTAERCAVDQAAKGVAAMVAAALVWGLSSLWYKALGHVPAVEVLAHRTLWSAVFLGIIVLVQGRAAEVRAALADRRVRRLLALAAVLIATNWLVFISAVQSGHALEASLGYYIFPLVAVVLGFVFQGERLSRLQVAAVVLAASAVAVLAFGLGGVPRVALTLALSFGAYGLLKARQPLGPVISVLIETLLLAPLALMWLVGLHGGVWADPVGRPGGLFLSDALTTAMLIGSGPLTALPLILFSFAARRISYASVGLIQYLNPTIQFVVAVMIFGEVFTLWHGVAFPLIWVALALYTAESWRRSRRAEWLAGPP